LAGQNYIKSTNWQERIITGAKKIERMRQIELSRVCIKSPFCAFCLQTRQGFWRFRPISLPRLHKIAILCILAANAAQRAHGLYYHHSSPVMNGSISRLSRFSFIHAYRDAWKNKTQQANNQPFKLR